MAREYGEGGTAMSQQPRPHLLQERKSGWQWPLDLARYDRTPQLRPAEQEELDMVMCRRNAGASHLYSNVKYLQRLLHPIQDALRWTQVPDSTGRSVVSILMQEMDRRRTSFWGWTHDEWIEIFGPSTPAFVQRYNVPRDARVHLLAFGYLLGVFTDLHAVGSLKQVLFAFKVFGQEVVEHNIQRVSQELLSWGYGTDRSQHYAAHALCEALLLNRSPRLEDLTTEVLEQTRQENIALYLKRTLSAVSRALVILGCIQTPLGSLVEGDERFGNHDALADVPAEWASWCQRWLETTTMAPASREGFYYLLLKAGRWLAARHPEASSPECWDRELAIEFVAAVDRMTVGEWAKADKMHPEKIGKSLSARARDKQLAAMRLFFRDCQEWGWLSRRFDPRRSFATPRSIRALIAPDPRIVSDDTWAKLLWAGLNLTEDDLPRTIFQRGPTQVTRESWYPLEMVRAIVMVWLFAGLRSNEIRRLRVGCIRWLREDMALSGTTEVLHKEMVCWLDVPVHKTGTAFTKAVDHVVGEAIEVWERARPPQPNLVDPKTAESVQYLFAYRGRAIGKAYLNHHLIPLLCRQAGVPGSDIRGNITSHRARSTIASQLYNAKEPLSLFDLQEWLGHRLLSSTQAYAKKSPTKVAKAYEKAGYFDRNLRTINVLIDQETVKSGAAAAGEPWRFYDLGHGYCLYEFFDQCPHRMACAKCSFYLPKGSSQAQLLEGKANLLRMLQEIPLNEEERAAAEDGIEAMEKLCQQLADVPTPAGPTPSQLAKEQLNQRRIISVEQVRRKRQS